MTYPIIECAIGKTPLVAPQRIGAAENRRAATCFQVASATGLILLSAVRAAFCVCHRS